MKNKVFLVITAVSMFFLSVFVFNYLKSHNRLSESRNNYLPVRNITAEEISRLEYNILVRFPAKLIKRSGSSCIELFTQDNFKKYNGDPKHAIFSRFVFEPRSADWFEKSSEAMVTGKMTFIKDAADTSSTCGIVTGRIFEITEIEYF